MAFCQRGSPDIAFLIHTRYIPDPEQLNQQRFKCAAQMREPLYIVNMTYLFLESVSVFDAT